MATHSSILVCKIPWTEEAGGLQSMGSKRVREDLATDQTVVVTYVTAKLIQRSHFSVSVESKGAMTTWPSGLELAFFFMSVGIVVKTCMPWHRGWRQDHEDSVRGRAGMGHPHDSWWYRSLAWALDFQEPPHQGATCDISFQRILLGRLVDFLSSSSL